MRSVPAFSSRSVVSVAFVVALGGLSAACSDSIRMQQPLFTGSTENQREILGAAGPNDGSASAYVQPMPQVADNSVSSSALPPPSSYTPPPTSYASVDPADDYASTSGAFEWSAVGGRVVTIGPTDTLDTLVARYGVPGDQILNANQMHSAGEVRVGKIMVIPRRVPIATDRLQDNSAPVVASTAPVQPPVAAMPAIKPTPTVATVVTGSTYVVMSGDTLFSVARKVNMTPAELASLNGITVDTQIQLGQKLKIKGTKPTTVTASADTTKPTQLGAPPHPLGTLTFSKDGSQLAANPPTIRTTTSTGTDAAADTQVAANTPVVPAITTAPTPAATNASLGTADVDSAMDSASADGTTFRWPVRGRIISGFGTKPNGEKNDGINLAVPAGTAVKAVEAGTVIYAGNELAGYGNLVLIRHADGWVSAYANNQDLLVKRGDVVTRGEIIAHAGMTGSVTSPQVHFELRKGAKPVNPLDYLAGA